MTVETAVEPNVAWSWGEDILLVLLCALVGGSGMAAGVATDSQVETSIGLVMVMFAGRVLAEVIRTRSRRPRRPTGGTC